LLHRPEAEQALSRREELAEARLLRQDRAAGGQVAGAAIAEPAGPEANVLVLGDGELASRAAQVVAIRLEVSGEARGAPDAPPMRTQPRRVVAVQGGRGQLERLGRPEREVEKLQELVVLAPGVELALPADVLARLPPVRDGGEGRRL